MGDNSTQKLAEVCLSCDLVKNLETTSVKFVAKLNDSMIDPINSLFVMAIVLWLTIKGIEIAIGRLKLEQFSESLFYIFITVILLTANAQGFLVTVFKAAISTMSGAASAVFRLANDSTALQPETQLDGLAYLMYATEQGVKSIFMKCVYIINNGGVFDKMILIPSMALLFFPFGLLVLTFLAQVATNLFRIVSISAFAPALSLFYAFGWGRPMVQAALRALLGAIMVLFSCSLTVGLVLYFMNALLGSSEFMAGNTSKGLAIFKSVHFWSAIFIGWMGVALQTEGVGLANSITGTAFSNTSIGVMSAGMATSAFFAWRKLLPATRQGISTAAGAYLDPGGAAKKVVGGAKSFGERLDQMRGGGGSKP